LSFAAGKRRLPFRRKYPSKLCATLGVSRRMRRDGTSPQRSDIRLLLVARGVRGFGDGFATIVLPAYLVAIGFGTVEIGVVAAASLLGSAVLHVCVGLGPPAPWARP